MIPDSDYTIEDVAIDISVDVDSTGIYEYAFYRMFESVKKTKDDFSKATFAQTMREENLYEGQAQTIECNFWDKGLYKALLGDSTFAESLLSSEWYYQTHGASSSALEQTAIVAGYLKSVEQLLFAVVRFSIDSGKTIKRKGYDRTAYVDYSFENESFVDYSLGSLIGYIRHYSDLWIVNSFAKNYVCDKLSIFRDKYRNDHFHKDNITSIEEIREIRNYSLFMMYLILGALRIDEPHVEDLGIKNPTEEVKRKEGLSYSSLEKWLDRILGGDVLLPVDSNIYFCVGVWGTEQWRLEFSTVSGFSDQGFPENSEWPYIGDDFKWDSCGEGKEEAEASVIEMLKRYQSGAFALSSWDSSNLKEPVSFLSFSTHRTKRPGLATDDIKKTCADDGQISVALGGDSCV